jgi:hypothetical protein
MTLGDAEVHYVYAAFIDTCGYHDTIATGRGG